MNDITVVVDTMISCRLGSFIVTGATDTRRYTTSNKIAAQKKMLPLLNNISDSRNQIHPGVTYDISAFSVNIVSYDVCGKKSHVDREMQAMQIQQLNMVNTLEFLGSFQ
jgi:hypothetical protein